VAIFFGSWLRFGYFSGYSGVRATSVKVTAESVFSCGAKLAGVCGNRTHPTQDHYVTSVLKFVRVTHWQVKLVLMTTTDARIRVVSYVKE
jgi:hypothetical protein